MSDHKAWPDWDEFVRRLREDPAFREEVRRQVLTEDLLNLPAVVSRVLNLQGQTLEAVRGMAAAVEAFVGEVRTAFGRVEAQIASLAEQVRALTKKTDDMDRTLSRHGQFVGVALEDRARDFLLRWLPTRSLRLLTPLYRVAQGNWEIDGVAEAEDPKGRLWLLVEVKGRLDRGDIRRFARKIRSSKVRAILRSSLGVRGRVQPWVWAAVLGRSAEEEARKAGVGLIEPRFGALVEPAERVWEDERP
jgi:hypothetical protein